MGGCDVGLDWGERLRVAHFDEGPADGNSLLDVEGDCYSFGLSNGSHDGADGMTFGEDRSVWNGIRMDVGRWWIVARVVVSCRATARFGINEICCVTVNVEACVTSLEPYDGVKLRGCVVHQHICFLDCVGSWKLFFWRRFC